MEEDGRAEEAAVLGLSPRFPAHLASPQLVKFPCGALQLGLDGRQTFNLLILHMS